MNHSNINTLTGYLGTYASDKSKGIYSFSLDCSTGTLSLPKLFYPASDCKYLSQYGNLLVSPIQAEGQAGICLIDTTGGKAQLLDDIYKEDTTSCFVTQDQDFVYTANYHQGILLIYKKTVDGLSLYKRIEIAKGAGCHQILFHKNYMLVPCLLMDEIRIFDCSHEYCHVGSISYQKGTGPRHGVFTRDHHFFFLVSELSNELYTYRMTTDNESDKTVGWNTPSMELISIYPLLPEKYQCEDAPASAAIRLSPDERFLYVSTRFIDIISVFTIEHGKVKLIQQTGSGGIHPRDFVITKDGSFLLAANRTEGGLVCFPVNRNTGLLERECSRVPAPEAVSIVL